MVKRQTTTGSRNTVVNTITFDGEAGADALVTSMVVFAGRPQRCATNLAPLRA